MATCGSENNNFHKKDGQRNCILIHLDISKRIAFLVGTIFGFFILRHQVISSSSDYILETIRGYEFNHKDNCIVVRKTSGEIDYCRPPIDCQMCQDVKAIDVVSSIGMSPDLFREKYAYSGRPVLVKGAANQWTARDTFDFEFFRDLYEDLDSPVLDNKDSDCQFFAWDFHEFNNMQEVFDMPDERWKMMGNYTPWYIGWANCDEEAAEILRQHYESPDFLPIDSESGRRDWVFIGTPGFGAPMHLDNVKYPSWQAQIRGIKQWSLQPPPECYWSCSGEMTVTMEPGDVIAVNTNLWYHSTRVLKDLSVTVTNEYQ